jgi:GTPase involved in cell partitioning and DNA repair
VAPESGETPEGEMTLADADPETLLYAYDLVESELAQYSEKLAGKPRVVCLTKIDLLTDESVRTAREAFARREIDLIPISSTEERHLDKLKLEIERLVLGGAEKPAAEPREENREP